MLPPNITKQRYLLCGVLLLLIPWVFVHLFQRQLCSGQTRIAAFPSNTYIANIPLSESVLRVAIYPPSTDIVSWHLYHGGEIMTEVLEVFSHLPEDGNGRLFLDIGANLAIYGLLASAHNYRTLAFEPVQSSYELARVSAEIFNNFDSRHFTILNKALGDTAALVTMHTRVLPDPTSLDYGSSSLLDFTGTSYRTREIVNNVQMVQLDTVVREHVFFAKLDVEGFEFKVMQGAKRVFGELGVDIVFMEFNLSLLQVAGVDRNQLFDEVMQYDYVVFRDASMKQLVQPDGYDALLAELDTMNIMNFLFVKADVLPLLRT